MDEVMSAHDMKEEGLRLFQEGLYPEAAEKFEQARRTFESEGEVVEAAEMLNNIGIVHRMRREWDQAIEALERAQSAFAELSDRSREAQVLGNLGRPLRKPGPAGEGQGISAPGRRHLCRTRRRTTTGRDTARSRCAAVESG